MKRIYVVKVVHEVDMPVFAESADKARIIASENIEEAFMWDEENCPCVSDCFVNNGIVDMYSIPWGQHDVINDRGEDNLNVRELTPSCGCVPKTPRCVVCCICCADKHERCDSVAGNHEKRGT